MFPTESPAILHHCLYRVGIIASCKTFICRFTPHTTGTAKVSYKITIDLKHFLFLQGSGICRMTFLPQKSGGKKGRVLISHRTTFAH